MFEKLKKKLNRFGDKTVDQTVEEMNYPTSSGKIQLSIFYLIICWFMGGSFFVIGNELSKLIGLGLFIVGIYVAYEQIYKPLKSYETRYGSTKMGDKWFNKLNDAEKGVKVKFW